MAFQVVFYILKNNSREEVVSPEICRHLRGRQLTPPFPKRMRQTHHLVAGWPAINGHRVAVATKDIRTPSLAVLLLH